MIEIKHDEFKALQNITRATTTERREEKGRRALTQVGKISFEFIREPTLHCTDWRWLSISGLHNLFSKIHKIKQVKYTFQSTLWIESEFLEHDSKWCQLH